MEVEVPVIKRSRTLDVLLTAQGETTGSSHFSIFKYFKKYNLLSYKSFRDKFSRKDIDDAVTYLSSFLRTRPQATYKNSTVTVIVSVDPFGILEKYYRGHYQYVVQGHYQVFFGPITVELLNVEKLDLKGEDGHFLSVFTEKVNTLSVIPLPKKRIGGIIKRMVLYRLKFFEGESIDIMGAEADITDFVLPYIEEAREKGMMEGVERGIERGRVEGMERGIERGRVEGMERGIERGRMEGVERGRVEGMERVARRLLKQGLPVKQVALGTGLSVKAIKSLVKK